jgi:hypothetical protein
MEIQLNLNATRIEIPTDAVIRENEIVDYLNGLSTHITNHTGKLITTWHFDDASKVLKAVLKVQEADVPFRWIEEELEAFIIIYGMEADIV